MQPWLRRFVHFWLHKVNPRIVTLVATIGTFGLLSCLATLYLVAQLSDEVLEREAFGFDQTILLGIHQFATPAIDSIMLQVTKLGDPSPVVLIALISWIILWWRRYYLEAKIFVLNCLGGAILNYGLKLAFSKPRPQLWKSPITETSYSYPSGHAMGSMVLYGFLAYILTIHYPKYAQFFYSLAAILIMAIGFSRLYLGVHWPTDIIAGYGVGFLWITLCITMLKLQKTE